ncbi:MAG: hypothetical protein ACK502_06655 [Alphaproteobacteria bacterium]
MSSIRNIVYLTASCLSLAGCQTMHGWADYVGGYMPVIGERCNHWQCFTNDTEASTDSTQQEIEAEKSELTQDDDDTDDANSTEPKRSRTFTDERPPIIPPSTESGVPDVELRGARKPFPKQY